MNHYYIQGQTSEVAEALNTVQKNALVDAAHIYTDTEEGNEGWEHLMKDITAEDRLLLQDISDLALDTHEFKAKLEELIHKQVEVYDLNDQKVSLEQIRKVVEFTLGKGLYKQRIRQRKGIDKALKEKHNGTGDYGRPRVTLPDDFEENIKRIMAKQMSHETYRSSLGMKRSTYFKVVKELKDSWKKAE